VLSGDRGPSSAPASALPAPGLLHRADDGVQVEDHDHPAIAQDGVAAEHAGVAKDGRQRLDDDLLGVEHLIDQQADAQGADADHHHVGGPVGPRRLGRQAQNPA
jgi:hypothetical protein